MRARVIGAGLAGCEAAWALAQRGVAVELYEQKPARFSPAHSSPDFAELVCSNSLKSLSPDSAAGLLKNEMRLLGSVTLAAADRCRVPAGGALAVDRTEFSRLVTLSIRSHPLITVIEREYTEIDLSQPTVIATGPLTEGALAEAVAGLCGQPLSFFDAAAPIVTGESLDRSRVHEASRYGKGTPDYLNCYFDREGYLAFHRELVNARTARLHDFDYHVYEGCMPIEKLASRGEDSIRFGPLKPVGLTDPATGRRPWAAVQLRREDRRGELYNLVGFQTNLAFPEQKRVFRMIPGLENAEFVRYGVMHRNTFLCSPRLLTEELCLRGQPNLYFAGQITGTEGYMESAMGGIAAGRALAARLAGRQAAPLPETTMSGALLRYVSSFEGDFQPMGANMGILPPLGEAIRDKKKKYALLAQRAIDDLKEVLADEDRD